MHLWHRFLLHQILFMFSAVLHGVIKEWNWLNIFLTKYVLLENRNSMYIYLITIHYQILFTFRNFSYLIFSNSVLIPHAIPELILQDQTEMSHQMGSNTDNYFGSLWSGVWDVLEGAGLQDCRCLQVSKFMGTWVNLSCSRTDSLCHHHFSNCHKIINLPVHMHYSRHVLQPELITGLPICTRIYF